MVSCLEACTATHCLSFQTQINLIQAGSPIKMREESIIKNNIQLTLIES